MVAAFLLSWEVPSLKLYLWLSLTPIILPSQSSMCHVRWQSWCFSCRLVKLFDFTYPGKHSDRWGEGEGKTMEECGKMALRMRFQLVYPCLNISWFMGRWAIFSDSAIKCFDGLLCRLVAEVARLEF